MRDLPAAHVIRCQLTSLKVAADYFLEKNNEQTITQLIYSPATGRPTITFINITKKLGEKIPLEMFTLFC